MRYNGIEKTLSGFQANTTNNRMELTAAIKALEALNRPCVVNLYTDSEYVKKGITKWIVRWKRNWSKGKSKSIKKKLDEVRSVHQVSWFWVRGHSGHPDNELVDRLAVQARINGSKSLSSS